MNDVAAMSRAFSFRDCSVGFVSGPGLRIEASATKVRLCGSLGRDGSRRPLSTTRQENRRYERRKRESVRCEEQTNDAIASQPVDKDGERVEANAEREGSTGPDMGFPLFATEKTDENLQEEKESWYDNIKKGMDQMQRDLAREVVTTESGLKATTDAMQEWSEMLGGAQARMQDLQNLVAQQRKGQLPGLERERMAEIIEEEIREIINNIDEDGSSSPPDPKERGKSSASPTDFKLPLALSLAGFAFEAYNNPKSAAVMHGINGNDYYLTSADFVRSYFSGLVMLRLTEVEPKLGPLAMPYVRIVVGKAIYEKPIVDQLLSFYVHSPLGGTVETENEIKTETIPANETKDAEDEKAIHQRTQPAESKVKVELWASVPENKRVGSAEFDLTELGMMSHGSREIHLNIYKITGSDQVSSKEVVGQVTIDGSYVDLTEEGDADDEEDEDDSETLSSTFAHVFEEEETEENGDLMKKDREEVVLKDESDAPDVFYSTAKQLKNLSTREWTKLLDLVAQSPLRLDRMDRIALVSSEGTDTQYVAWKSEKQLVIAFRGTEQTSWKDALTDSMAFLCPFEPGCDDSEIDIDLWRISERNVRDTASEFWRARETGGGEAKPAASRIHYGFLRAYAGIRGSALEVLGKLTEGGSAKYQLYLTGHSLGGALAALMASDVGARYPNLPVTMYNFGAPKVGNLAFARRFESLVPNAYRIVNNSDIVVRMPRKDWEFYHGGRCVLVGEDGFLWVDDGTKEGRSVVRQRTLEDSLRKEMNTVSGIMKNSTSLVNDHLEDAYFQSFVSVSSKVLNSEEGVEGDRKTKNYGGTNQV